LGGGANIKTALESIILNTKTTQMLAHYKKWCSFKTPGPRVGSREVKKESAKTADSFRLK
jgi:hypothetical protein